MPTVWFYQNIATNKQNTYSRKPLLHHANAINIRPKHKKRQATPVLVVAVPPNVSFFFVCTFPFCRTKPTNLSKRSSFLVGSNLLFCRLLCAKRPCISVVYTLLYNHYNWLENDILSCLMSIFAMCFLLILRNTDSIRPLYAYFLLICTTPFPAWLLWLWALKELTVQWISICLCS